MQLNDLTLVHMVGIRGTGMSALALALAKLGIRVTGSDSIDSFLLLDQKNFDQAGITIATPFDEKNISQDISAVITSTSHSTGNPEILQAKKLGIPVLAYPEVLGMLTREFKSIAICGSHGKTTTTNLLAHVLQQAGMPILALAGPTSQQVLAAMSLPDLSSKSFSERDWREKAASRFQQKSTTGFAERSGRRIFVFEADEYQNKLAMYSPFGIVLTNVELDHPDYFKTEAEYEKVFEDFIKKVPAGGFFIDGRTIPYEVGKHFEFDAELVTLAAQKLGVSDDAITKGIASFEGSPRRMQKISDDPLIFDDYGHHPTEIKTTLRALRNKYPDREIWAVFHPHTYTRTQKFLKEFGASFSDADHVIVLDIFESREVGKQTISSRDVVDEIKSHGIKAEYAPTFEDAAKVLKDKLNDKTLLLTIGAGDVWRLHKMI